MKIKQIIDALPKLSQYDLTRLIVQANAEDRKRFDAACAAHPSNQAKRKLMR